MLQNPENKNNTPPAALLVKRAAAQVTLISSFVRNSVQLNTGAGGGAAAAATTGRRCGRCVAFSLCVVVVTAAWEGMATFGRGGASGSRTPQMSMFLESPEWADFSRKVARKYVIHYNTLADSRRCSTCLELGWEGINKSIYKKTTT